MFPANPFSRTKSFDFFKLIEIYKFLITNLVVRNGSVLIVLFGLSKRLSLKSEGLKFLM